LGILISLSFGFRLTGLVISQGESTSFFFIGILMIVGGLVLFSLETRSRLEITLYKQPSRKGEDVLYMTDPENLFGKKGTVSLEQFRKEMEEIRKDPELLNLVRETYFIPLTNRLNEGGGRFQNSKRIFGGDGT